jgi:hypothetical protein
MNTIAGKRLIIVIKPWYRLFWIVRRLLSAGWGKALSNIFAGRIFFPFSQDFILSKKSLEQSLLNRSMTTHSAFISITVSTKV